MNSRNNTFAEQSACWKSPILVVGSFALENGDPESAQRFGRVWYVNGVERASDFAQWNQLPCAMHPRQVFLHQSSMYPAQQKHNYVQLDISREIITLHLLGCVRWAVLNDAFCESERYLWEGGAMLDIWGPYDVIPVATKVVLRAHILIVSRPASAQQCIRARWDISHRG